MRRFVSLSLHLLVVALVIGGGGAAAQKRVGISSAVNPQAVGTPPGAAARPLIIGQDVVFNERITTTTKGQTQLLFVDESSMSVGPNSDLTIDQFVYDPKSGSGRLAMSATRGLLRYVGGKLSKHDGAVTLRTSTATLAVRGGAFILSINAGGRTEIIFIYGAGLTVTNLAGAVQTITRPGFAVTITPTGSMSSPQAVSSAVLGALTSDLDGQPGQNGGANVTISDATVGQQTADLSQTLGNIINTTLTQQNVVPNGVQGDYNQQPNVVGVVCDAGNNCSLVISGSAPLTSPPSPPPPSPPSPPPQPNPPVTIAYGGQIKGTSNRAVGFTQSGPPSSSSDGTVAFSAGALTFTSGAPQNAVFSGTFGNFGTLSFPLPLCSTGSGGCRTTFTSGTSSVFGTFSGTTYMSADDDFFYATITPASAPGVRLFIYGGAPVDAGLYQPTGSTRVFAFTVQPDAALQANLPFLRAQAGGNLPNASVSPLYVVAPPITAIGDTGGAAAARGLQASLAVSGQGANQQSAIAVAAGTIGGQNGQPVFTGALRGSAMLAAGGSPTAVQGGITSTLDGNGVSFYGGTGISGVVLTQTSAGVSETPLSGSSTAYGFAQPALPANVPAGVGASRTTQALSGYFGGLMATNAQASPYIVAGNVLVSTEAATNRLAAQLSGTARSPSSGVSGLVLNYGGLTGNNPNQAFVDDNTFAAAESATTPQQITIRETTRQPAGQLYFVSAGAAGQPTNLLPAGASFCQCQYLKWGYWGGSLTTSNPSDPPRIDAAHINTWVAGSMTPLADMQTLETQMARFTYTGAAIGSVFNNGNTYLAAGGFSGTYNFGSQTGTVQVNNFDNHTFSVSGRAPLSGATYAISGSANGFSGTVNGAFYGPKAAETGGNFTFQSMTPGINYLASGTFAGKR